MQAVLEEAGGSLADLVDVTVFLANMADYAEFNMVSRSLLKGNSKIHVSYFFSLGV